MKLFEDTFWTLGIGEIIKKHWMTIGRSSKIDNFLSRGGWTQTGEKGIGRFALDRIANNCRMLTGTEDSGERLLWTVDWGIFAPGKNITDVNAVKKINIVGIAASLVRSWGATLSETQVGT